MSVGSYYSIICNNPGMIFEIFERTNLIFILVHHDSLYSNLSLTCPLALDSLSYL